MNIPGKWVEQAACLKADPEIFFPDRGEPALPAKQICATCPVVAPCLEYALDNDEHWGVWGGMSENDRRNMRRGRPVRVFQPCGTEAAYSRHRRRGEPACRLCLDAHSAAMACSRSERRGAA